MKQIEKKKENNIQPPIGGANLECIFSYQYIPRTIVVDMLDVCYSLGFMLVDSDPLLVYGDDPIEPIIVASANRFEEFETSLERQSVQHCIVNMIGTLVDVKTPLSLVVDFRNSIVTISSPEDFLWNFSGDAAQADFIRLKAFAEICKGVATRLMPVFSFIGTETFHAEDMHFDKAEETFRFDDSFFSEERFKELYDWYLNTYVCRWSK